MKIYGEIFLTVKSDLKNIEKFWNFEPLYLYLIDFGNFLKCLKKQGRNVLPYTNMVKSRNI